MALDATGERLVADFLLFEQRRYFDLSTPIECAADTQLEPGRRGKDVPAVALELVARHEGNDSPLWQAWRIFTHAPEAGARRESIAEFWQRRLLHKRRDRVHPARVEASSMKSRDYDRFMAARSAIALEGWDCYLGGRGK
jgi:hypothetical protein